QFIPFYTAEAYISVKPPKASALGTTTGLVDEDVMNRLMASNARMVQVESVLGEAIKDPFVQRTQWYQQFLGQQRREVIIGELKKELSVSPIVGTDMIRIAMTGPNPIDLPVIINAVSQAFVTQRMQIATRDVNSQITQLQDKERTLRQKLESSQANAGKIRQKVDIPSLQQKLDVLNVKLRTYTTESLQLSAEVAQARASLEATKQQIESGELGKSPIILNALNLDPMYRSLLAQKVNTEAALEAATEKYGPKSQKYRDIQVRLGSIQKQVEQREKEVISEQAAMMIGGLQLELAAKTQRQIAVETDLKSLNAEIGDLAEALEQFRRLDAEIQDTNENLKRISVKLLDLGILVEDKPVEIQNEATVPLEPSMPRWSIMIPLGTLLGLFIGVGTAFILEFIDTSIKGPSDISRRVDLPLLGMVPHTDDVEDEIRDLRLAFMTNPNSLVCESFRQIRTCLLFSGPAGGRKTILVTSPMPEDGRTTVAMNLAASIAHGGRKALVIDANFRQPMIRRLFPQCGEAGLSNALVGQAAWRDMVQEVEENLFVLPSGPLPPNPAELLGSDMMRAVLKETSGEYEQVVIDGAPCLVVTDSSVLSSLTDGTLLVVRAGVNTYGIVQRTKDMLQRVGAHVLGVVLNGVRVTSGGYLRKNYETFYEYHHSQPGLPRPEETQVAEAAAETK
ncbi:MAG TPA: polysaccharide biosynthesis tyrosine autokinase, partial [Phycisphaerae bacterium]|nr:polysaccharide biosynthesis tyrosine autokinase [Phycisphaerae bacterium]